MKDEIVGKKLSGERKDETTKRRQQVARLYWRGYNRQQIADELHLPKALIISDVKAIERFLSPKTDKTLKYLQNSAVERLRPIQVLMWEIIDQTPRDNIKISAGRLVKDVEEQVNKVRGIIGERVTEAPDKALAELIKQAKKVDAESFTCEGHTVKDDETDVSEKLPDYFDYLKGEIDVVGN